MEACKVVTLAVFFSFALTLASSADDSIIFPLVPDSITFNTVEALHSSDVADIFSAMLSYSLPKPCSWQSLGPVNPFKTTRGFWIFDIQGFNSDVQPNIPGTKFPLENLNDFDNQYTILTQRTKMRFGESTHFKPIMLKISADDELYGPKSEQRMLLQSIPADAESRLEKAKQDPDLGRTMQEGTFNASIPADANFLVELATVKLMLASLLENKLNISQDVPNVFWIEKRGYHGIIQEYGADSIEAKEAVRLLELTIMECVRTMKTVFNNNAVVTVILEANLPYLSRKSRVLLQETTTAPPLPPPTPATSPPDVVPQQVIQPYKYVENYEAFEFEDDFHVAFALIAFTSIMLILTVLGVSVGLWFMDPGRDSIIYRMTSQRKKD